MDYEVKEMLFSTGQVFGFPVDLPATLSQLQQDMRDDWYADALGYGDIFKDKDYIAGIILNCLNSWGGAYAGDQRTVRPIPKKDFAERYSLETDFFDRFVYQSICAFLVPHLDEVLSHRVLSYRYNRDTRDGKYLFRHKISKWLDYEGLTYRFWGNGGALAATDVSNFFENISSDQLISSLNCAIDRSKKDGYTKGQMLAASRLLSALFDKWTLNGNFGLPQNRDCSSFLSNVLLSEVDFEMQSQGYDYYRYVDDIRVVCQDEYEARRSLQSLISLLREVGMNINTAKTTILTCDSPRKDIEEHFPSQNPLTSAISSMWKSKSRRVFIRSIEYIVEILRKCLQDGDTQAKSFRFAVFRLGQLIEAELFDVRGKDAEDLLEYALAAIRTDAVSSDQLCKLILVLKPESHVYEDLAQFLLNRNNCIHDWQNHKIWMLLASSKYDTPALRDLSNGIVCADPTTGEAAAIFIWMQAIGFSLPIEKTIARYEGSWPFINQRYFLIAVGLLSDEKQKPLRGKVPPKLLGTTRRARTAFRSDGVAIAERERPSFADLYHDIKDYS